MFYFAYGSNLDLLQMNERCPEAVAVKQASLPHHKLAFVGYSKRWGGGVANVVPARNQIVRGLLFEVTEKDLQILDIFEGAPIVYRRRKVSVIDNASSWSSVITYVRDHGSHAAPSANYLEVLRRAYNVLGFDLSALELSAQGF